LALKLFTTKDWCRFQNLETFTKSGARVTIVQTSSKSELDFAQIWQKTIQLAIYVSKMSRMYAILWQSWAPWSGFFGRMNLVCGLADPQFLENTVSLALVSLVLHRLVAAAGSQSLLLPPLGCFSAPPTAAASSPGLVNLLVTTTALSVTSRVNMPKLLPAPASTVSSR